MDQTNTSAGGSDARDFQPPTQNPQGNVGGGLQPNAAGNSGIFNQTGINQQELPSTGSLQVQNNGTTNSTPPSRETSGAGMGWVTLPVLLISAVITMGTIRLLSKKPKPARMAEEVKQPAEAPTKVAPKKPRNKSTKKKQRKKK